MRESDPDVFARGPFGLTPPENHVMCVPTDAARIPEDLKLIAANIITIQHRRINCDSCHQPCWIGLEQLKMARDPNCKVTCLVCIAADPPLLMAVLGKPAISLNPDADKLPRRSSSWLVTG